MNKCLKMLSLLALLGISSISLAYNWGFTNLTNKILVIKLKLAGTGDDFFNIVGPGQKTEFSWTRPNVRAGYCMSDLKVAEYDESKVENFSGTQSKKLPREIGKNTLDMRKITVAIDVRGPWFNSLNKLDWDNMGMRQVAGNYWNEFNEKALQAAEKIKTGTPVQQAMNMAGVNLGDAIKNSAFLPGSAWIAALKEACSSYDFIIIKDPVTDNIVAMGSALIGKNWNQDLLQEKTSKK